MEPGPGADAAAASLALPVLPGLVLVGGALAASVGGPVRGLSIRVCFLPPLCGSNAKHPRGLRQ